MTEIPVQFKDQSADFEQTINLDKIPVNIRLTYNTRVNYWYGSFTTENNKITYVKMVTNSLILKQFKASLSDILGDFMILRVTDDIDKPELTYENFGTDWGLFYLDVNEVLEYRTNNSLI